MVIPSFRHTTDEHAPASVYPQLKGLSSLFGQCAFDLAETEVGYGRFGNPSCVPRSAAVGQ